MGILYAGQEYESHSRGIEDMRPKDLSNSGQYWFVTEYKSNETIVCEKFHNVESGVEFRIWANELPMLDRWWDKWVAYPSEGIRVGGGV